MAERAKRKRQKQSLVEAVVSEEPGKPLKPVTVVNGASSNQREFTPVQLIAVRRFVAGDSIGQIARKLGPHIVPHEKDEKEQRKKARIRIRRWFRTQKFRDLIWEESILLIDMATPAIAQGLIRKAAAGRVDAIRLALELNGRHAPHTELTPAKVEIHFGDVPRPPRIAIDDPDTIDADPADVVELDDDDGPM